MYSILISNIVNKPIPDIYFENFFENTTLYWNKIYLSPLLATIDTTLRSFQYKILNNVLFLNKKLYSTLCSFCDTLEETPIHIFFDCVHVKWLWERLRIDFQKDFIFNEANGNYNLRSHILMIFKCYIYISREKQTLNIDILIANLIKVKNREKQVSIVVTISKREANKKKWCITDNILPVT